MTSRLAALLVVALMALFSLTTQSGGQDRGPTSGVDARVRAFVEGSRNDWHDLNVPFEDGQVLHDLVVRKGFTRGLEIGTSTGHSGTWIAWAMSRTGGKLITIEI